MNSSSRMVPASTSARAENQPAPGDTWILASYPELDDELRLPNFISFVLKNRTSNRHGRAPRIVHWEQKDRRVELSHQPLHVLQLASVISS
jgi:hypothetical protein